MYDISEATPKDRAGRFGWLNVNKFLNMWKLCKIQANVLIFFVYV